MDDGEGSRDAPLTEPVAVGTLQRELGKTCARTYAYDGPNQDEVGRLLDNVAGVSEVLDFYSVPGTTRESWSHLQRFTAGILSLIDVSVWDHQVPGVAPNPLRLLQEKVADGFVDGRHRHAIAHILHFGSQLFADSISDIGANEIGWFAENLRAVVAAQSPGEPSVTPTAASLAPASIQI